MLSGVWITKWCGTVREMHQWIYCTICLIYCLDDGRDGRWSYNIHSCAPVWLWRMPVCNIFVQFLSRDRGSVPSIYKSFTCGLYVLCAFLKRTILFGSLWIRVLRYDVGALDRAFNIHIAPIIMSIIYSSIFTDQYTYIRLYILYINRFLFGWMLSLRLDVNFLTMFICRLQNEEWQARTGWMWGGKWDWIGHRIELVCRVPIGIGSY